MDRRDALQRATDRVGETLSATSFALGEDDAYVAGDLPDNETAAAVAHAVNVPEGTGELDAASEKHVDFRPAAGRAQTRGPTRADTILSLPVPDSVATVTFRFPIDSTRLITKTTKPVGNVVAVPFPAADTGNRVRRPSSRSSTGQIITLGLAHGPSREIRHPLRIAAVPM